MELSERQITQFDEQGYLFFPGLLDRDEVAILQRAMPEILNRQGPEVVPEQDDPMAIRLLFGEHETSEPFRRLSLVPRLVNPSRQLLGDDVYLHQSRINPKQGFGAGAQWSWHQDYSVWHVIDGMPAPRCIMTAVFIDDCTPAKSPLLVIPGSHRQGLIGSFELNKHEKGSALGLIDRATVLRLAEKSGIEALIGPAGSVCFCHSIVVHGSANNISPWRRAIMYLIYNAVSNACTGADHAWYHNNRDFTPLLPRDDDWLKQLQRA